MLDTIKRTINARPVPRKTLTRNLVPMGTWHWQALGMLVVAISANGANMDSMAVEREIWKDKSTCNLSYFSDGRLKIKQCMDSLSKATKKTTYAYDGSGRLGTEVCESQIDQVPYEAEYQYGASGVLVSKQTKLHNPERTVITSYRFDNQGRISSEVQASGAGVLIDSLAYFYENEKLVRKELYENSKMLVGEQRLQYDNTGRLTRIVFYAGSPDFLLLSNSVNLTYKLLSELVAPTSLVKNGLRLRGGSRRENVLPDGRRVEKREMNASLPFYFHE